MIQGDMTALNTFEYIQYGAGSKDSSAVPEKLVFTMHGYGRNAHFMEKVAKDIVYHFPTTGVIGVHAPEALDLPEELDVSDMNMPDELLTPDGTLSEDMQRQWFSMHGHIIRIWWRIWRLRKRVNRFVDALAGHYGLECQDVIFIGFSQGGAAALYSALARKKAIGCVIGHSTVYWGKMPIRSKPPVYMLYGDKDKSISQSLYNESQRRLEKAGIDVTVFKFPGQGHYISTRSRARMVEILADYLV